MNCAASLFDPTKNQIKKIVYLSGDTYSEIETRVIVMNENLNKKPNKKELYWKITDINI